MKKRILIIKLSAFGDFFLSLGTFAYLRSHHADAHITLLTTAPFKDIALKSSYFDEVVTIERWSVMQIKSWFKYMRGVYARPFNAVYDMQSNDRTHILRMLSPSVMRHSWYDIRKHEDRPQGLPDLSGVFATPPSDMSWLSRHATIAPPTADYILLVPGCAPQHPAKRWPAALYAELACRISARGITPVIIGTASEAEAAKTIKEACPAALSLIGQTSMSDITALAEKALAAVGNDTGPMHLIALCRCPTISLFSNASDPAQSAPRGQHVTVLREPDLADLTAQKVEDALMATLDRHHKVARTP